MVFIEVRDMDEIDYTDEVKVKYIIVEVMMAIMILIYIYFWLVIASLFQLYTELYGPLKNNSPTIVHETNQTNPV